MWKFVDSGKNSPQHNMALDAKLLQEISPTGSKILHFYDWDTPCFTHGYFINPKDYLQLEQLQAMGVTWARRPTGGGIIFHTTDLAFSVLVPSQDPWYQENTLANYKKINDKVQQAVFLYIKETELKLLAQDPQGLDAYANNFCMAKPTIYDVMLDGKKIAGAAQRRVKNGLLHQGSISLAMPQENFLKSALIPGTRVLEGMQAHTYPLLKDGWGPGDILQTRKMLQGFLKKVFLED
jgi:lipoate-protein ligase A